MDTRTGRYSFGVPLLGIAGRGGVSFSLSLSYDQELSGLGVDRQGLGEGMGLGLPFVDAGNGRAVVAGGVYDIDDDGTGGGSATGLKRFPGGGVRFEHVPGGVLEAREGVGERGFEWRLTDLADGSVQYFDGDGNAAAFADRHGNRIDFAFEAAGDAWQLAAVTDAYGAVTEVSYGTDGGGEQVVFRAPARSGDGHRLTAVLSLEDGQVRTITGAGGGVTKLDYERPLSGHGAVISRMETPSGQVTEIGYEELPGSPVPALAAARLRTLDAEGDPAAPEQRFSASVEEGRNYTGAGGGFSGEDDVFDGRTGYTYTTEVARLDAEGNPEQRVVSLYNSLHLLVSQKVFTAALGDRAAGELHYSYGWQEEAGSPVPPAQGQELPASWADPVREVNTVYNSAGDRREVATAAEYDSYGRVVKATDETGTVTETVYDTGEGATGLVLSQKTTGRDGTVLQETVNTPTPAEERRTVAHTVTRTAGSGGRLAAREQASFEYDQDGQVTAQSVTWADGAQGDGPKELRTAIGREVKDGRLTETVTVAPGTESETATTRTIDLATGALLEETDPSGRVVSRIEYDDKGRPARHTAMPDSSQPQTTEISYPSPTQTVVATPDGRRTVQSVDALGRAVRTADNYRDGGYSPDADADGARVLSEADYSQWAKHQVTVTDAAGRKTTAVSDPWGHSTEVTRPDGTVAKSAADIVAEAVWQGVLGKDQASARAAEARAVTVRDIDSAQRTVSAKVVFADGTPSAGSAGQADALGRLLSSTSGEVITTPSYGAGGMAAKAALSPAAPQAYPGAKMTAELTHDLAGRTTGKTLTQDGRQDADTRAGTRNAYDEAGRLAVQTDQLGNTTSYTYHPDGQVKTATVETRDGQQVSQTVYAYDDSTGLLATATLTSAGGASTVRHMEYDRLNRITGIWEGASEAAKKDSLITYGYDGEGRMVSVAYPDGRTTSRAYDAVGQLVTATDAAGAVTAYAYNEDGTLKQAEQTTKDGQVSSAAYTYDGLGRPVKSAYGNGTVAATEYWDSGQPKKETLTGKDGAVLSQVAYTYNSRGELATRTDIRPTTAGGSEGQEGSGSTGGMTTTHTVHSYDAYGRLTGTVLHDGADAEAPVIRSTAYTANAAGDITTVTVTGKDGKKTVTEHETDPAGRLTAVTTDGTKAAQAYDAAGNLTTGADGTSYTYSPDNKPLTGSAKDGTRTEYAYWPDGSRKSSTTTSPAGEKHTVLFHYTPAGDIANDTHTTKDGQTRTAAYLTGLAGREHRTLDGSPDGAAYLHADRRGNTILETTSRAAASTSRYYTDYGQEARPDGTPLTLPPAAADPAANPFRFGGEYTNSETGTHYTPARTYDPATGRFTTRDPHPTPLNKYQAFDTNPVEHIDPSGNINISLRTKLQQRRHQNDRNKVARTEMMKTNRSSTPGAGQSSPASIAVIPAVNSTQSPAANPAPGIASPVYTPPASPAKSDPRFTGAKSGIKGVIAPSGIMSVPMENMKLYNSVVKSVQEGNVPATLEALASYRSALAVDYGAASPGGICAQSNLSALLTLSEGRAYVPGSQAVTVNGHDLEKTFGKPLAAGGYFDAVDAVNGLEPGQIAVLDAIQDGDSGHVAIILKQEAGGLYIDIENRIFTPGMNFKEKMEKIIKGDSISYTVYPGGTLHHSFRKKN
ncbi:RHS repeat domain-containing protein [Streptomyces sp. NRRL F-2664]|uniref:RHS repeat domain-containing protein n=1 Tax=Streptomyces sp. NRRL F-2664 TaxID=1463842 RepID=UPI00131CFF73|nr:RHS repeat-associated core domain-containing protein [Streptomyces sp. NRRL F-2664]